MWVLFGQAKMGQEGLIKMTREGVVKGLAMVCGAVAVCSACLFGAGVLIRNVDVVWLSTIGLLAGLAGVTLYRTDSS